MEEGTLCLLLRYLENDKLFLSLETNDSMPKKYYKITGYGKVRTSWLNFIPST
ncbi:MAG: hypothetical protein K8E24_013380 [Methanobacterium paludis]|nr:hypothetical protein [Methanobacterium paludis]